MRSVSVLLSQLRRVIYSWMVWLRLLLTVTANWLPPVGCHEPKAGSSPSNQTFWRIRHWSEVVPRHPMFNKTVNFKRSFFVLSTCNLQIWWYLLVFEKNNAQWRRLIRIRNFFDETVCYVMVDCIVKEKETDFFNFANKYIALLAVSEFSAYQ